MSALLGTPSYFRNVVEATWPVADVVAECLRLVTPTLFVVRITAASVSIGGTEIGPGEPLLVYLGAANRDPAVFGDPDDFRPGREGPPVVSFAYGSHYCLGASLARAEAEVMLKTVAQCWPRLSLRPGRPLRWHQRGPFRGLDELVVSALM